MTTPTDITHRAQALYTAALDSKPGKGEWPTDALIEAVAVIPDLLRENRQLRATIGRLDVATDELADSVTQVTAERDKARAEVERLRTENDHLRTIWDRSGKEDLIAERDALAWKVERVRALTASMDRGVGYRVSGKPETWDAYHEGMSDFAGQVEAALDEEETR